MTAESATKERVKEDPRVTAFKKTAMELGFAAHVAGLLQLRRRGTPEELEEHLRKLEGDPEKVKALRAALDTLPPPALPDKYFFDLTKKGSWKLNVERLGTYLKEDGHLCIGVDNRLYRYDAGVYRGDGERWVKVRCRELLKDDWRRAHTAEAQEWLSAHYPKLPEVPPVDTFNLPNGLLRWKTKKLLEHTPDFLSSVRIPVDWNPTATCPQILEWMQKMLPEDAIDYVFELLGYCLYPGNPLRVAVLLLGRGRNGKSELLRLFRLLCGAANVSAEPLQTLAENRFSAAELYGKVANVCGDLDARAVQQSETFKILTGGGDVLRAERKRKDPFNFVPFALPIFSANEAPISRDQTDAWFDRWHIIPMNIRISQGKTRLNIMTTLATPGELQGVLAHAVEGLRRLMKRGHFNLPASVLEANNKYRETLDSAQGWIKSGLVHFDPKAFSPRTPLYRDYRQWCDGEGRLPISSAKFYERLESDWPKKIRPTKQAGVRGFLGIATRNTRAASAMASATRQLPPKVRETVEQLANADAEAAGV